jgi:hypothetical protein
MKTIVAGSRGVSSYRIVAWAIESSGFDITEVISGGARGVDQLGEEWARKHKVPVSVFAADWRAQGKSAGVIRNLRMAECADALVAVWDDVSRGTKHMIETAIRMQLRVYVAHVDDYVKEEWAR